MRFGKLLAEDSPDSLLERLVIILWKYELCQQFDGFHPVTVIARTA